MIKITNVLLIRIGLWILAVNEFFNQCAESGAVALGETPFSLFFMWLGLALIFDPMYCAIMKVFGEGDWS